MFSQYSSLVLALFLYQEKISWISSQFPASFMIVHTFYDSDKDINCVCISRTDNLKEKTTAPLNVFGYIVVSLHLKIVS